MPRSASRDDIVVTGIGMRSAVGNDAVQSCATIRAGTSRFVTMPGNRSISVAGVWPEPENCSWLDKAPDLLRQPLHEALWMAQVYEARELRASWGPNAQLGVWLATPSPGRPEISTEDEHTFLHDTKGGIFAAVAPEIFELVAVDHAGGLSALLRAAQALQQDRVQLAIVAGIDSHLESAWLKTLIARGAIRLPSGRSGFVPGEAGAIAVFETRARAKARGARVLASLEAICIDKEAIPLGPEHPIQARGLSNVVQRCLDTHDAQDIQRVICDLNGERWRSLEWSLMETRCLGGLPRGFQLWHPADCIGDVGAASGLVGLAICVRAFARNYAGGGSALIVSASPSGDRAAAIMSPE